MIKIVGKSLYAHKTNIQELMTHLSDVQIEQLNKVIALGSNIDYCIIKYNLLNNNVSLILCDTWDTLNEPIVGDSYCFNLDGEVKIIKGGTRVYHNKWQFVPSDYTGFDIEESKRRTELWNQISEIKNNKSRIGNKLFWYKLLSKYNIIV
jgi:hypothetical protein